MTENEIKIYYEYATTLLISADEILLEIQNEIEKMINEKSKNYWIDYSKELTLLENNYLYIIKFIKNKTKKYFNSTTSFNSKQMLHLPKTVIIFVYLILFVV